ncbi:putative flippase GtrA [Paenibacillus castaneae]|nr:GtrA family protein [Paenibacillus castaneae]NIK76931.1 putative flippase GtrA [Paenibacillus castaneae]
MSRSHWKMVAAQFIKFNLIGLLNTAIDFLIFTLLIWFGTYYLLAQLLAYSAGMINSLVLNNRYTFGKGEAASKHSLDLKMSGRFLVWNSILLGISLLLLATLTNWWGMEAVLAKALVTVTTVGLNFYGSKKWVFVSKEPQVE